jgi:hypothetical protein
MMANRNILDYAKDNFKNFEDSPFNLVDSLILCQLFYSRMEAQIKEESKEVWTVKDLYKAEYFGKMFFDAISDDENRELLTIMASNPRFRDIRIKNLIVESSEKKEMQFAAVTYELSAGIDYVCFRGTDGTLIGWKEDFNMAFMSETPSQANAVRYLKVFYEEDSSKKIYVGGHSKGGNLAVYSACYSDEAIQDKIIQIFSHDGPGFRDELFSSYGYLSISDRVIKMVPQTSVIGMLLETQEDFMVIKSTAKGIAQHSAFTWSVEDDDFEYMEGRTKEGEYLDNTIHMWLMEASLKDREIFVDALFTMFANNGINTVKDLDSIGAKDMVDVLNATEGLDEESKKVFYSLLKKLIFIGVTGKNESILKRLEIDKKPFERIISEINNGILPNKDK